jgi:ArsR family transcriptional regulator, arsenate/arsenite/antimonite-responsive transcriptional repressor
MGVQAAKLKHCSKDYERLKKYKNSNLSCDDLKDGKVCFYN